MTKNMSHQFTIVYGHQIPAGEKTNCPQYPIDSCGFAKCGFIISHVKGYALRINNKLTYSKGRVPEWFGRLLEVYLCLLSCGHLRRTDRSQQNYKFTQSGHSLHIVGPG